MPIGRIVRRHFLAAVAGAAAWPLRSWAQQPAMPLVGALINGSPQDARSLVAPFRDGLGDQGYIEGQNVAVEYRWAEGHNERLSSLAAELINLRVAVLATLYGASAALAAKALTNSIPIVFLTGGDASELGIVANPDRPEANLTGVSGITDFLVARQIDLLRTLVPNGKSFALLTNPASANANRLVQITQASAKSIRRELVMATASNESELDSAFALLAERRPDGVVIPTNAFFLSTRKRIVALAEGCKLAAVYDVREFVEAGGLISYGQSTDRFRQVGIYVGKILQGATPADLPVVRPSKFELVVNRKAARALNLDLPTSILSRADEVID
jgi:putative tryptophan/tyrosine transport system substrate-binding protein